MVAARVRPRHLAMEPHLRRLSTLAFAPYAALAVLAIDACGTAPAPAEAPGTPDAPTTVAPGAPAVTGLDQVEDAGTKALLGEWLARRGATGRSHEVAAVSQVSNAADVLVLETTRGRACRVATLVVEVSLDDRTTNDRTVGVDCCPGEPCTRDAAGWMVQLAKRRAARDHAGLAELVGEDRGLSVKLAWVDETDTLKEDDQVVTRAQVAAGGWPDVGWDPLTMYIGCEPNEGGTTSCNVGAGGIQQTWTWHIVGDRGTLLAITEDSH